MAVQREPVRLSFDASEFTAGCRIIAQRSGKAIAAWTLHDATWEPHDWSEFD